MLTIIIWVLIGVAAAWILYWIGVFVFTLIGIKKTLQWANKEVTRLPDEYNRMRKDVKNENTRSESIERFVKGTFVRWYRKEK